MRVKSTRPCAGTTNQSEGTLGLQRENARGAERPGEGEADEGEEQPVVHH